jgi:DNA topoisomerase I
MKLLIVESPSKAKTIEKYLKGKYTVRSSIGHVRDLPKSNKDAIDIDGGFIPHYVVSPDKKKVVSELNTLAKKADEVILATDPDREGEAIAWHLKELLLESKVSSPIKRATFHEITEPAIVEALKHPREIDEDLRRAQEARRVLDRLVGYDLSGLIWKKVRYGLSAGRVQSPALRILMEREREIRSFVPESYFVLSGLFSANKSKFTLTCDEEPKNELEADRIVAEAKKGSWKIISITESEMNRQAKPPFTTSTIQQTASTRLGFSPSRTMRVAQKLYEGGHITYMRTDSPTLSKEAQGKILALIEKEYGKEYVHPTNYKSTSKNAQEAHEGIRPTNITTNKNIGSTEDEKALYELIWERAISSQMVPAKILKTKVSANIEGKIIPNFSTNGSRVLFPGWLLVDTRARGEDVEVPKLSVDEKINLEEINKEGKQTEPPNRYTEAGLVKELEKRGIGRPSTYASIIQTIVDRGYVNKEGRTLFPTDTGDVVSTFLEENFGEYISDTFTAEIENKLDEIAGGTREYTKTLSDFYIPFKKDVDAKESIAKITTLGDAPKEFTCPKCGSTMDIKLGRTGKFLSCSKYPKCDGALTIDGKELGKMDSIGTDPKSGLGVYVLEGRFGPYVQLGENPPKEEKKKGRKKKGGVEESVTPKPRRASLPAGMKSEDVTLETALKLLELPRELGIHPELKEPVIANVGRFGPYVGVGREFRSIKKGDDPYTITLERALEMLNQPKTLPKGVTLARTLGKHPKTGKELQILKSKSGFFIKQGLKRIFLPNDIDVETITLEEVVGMLNEGKKK